MLKLDTTTESESDSEVMDKLELETTEELDNNNKNTKLFKLQCVPGYSADTTDHGLEITHAMHTDKSQHKNKFESMRNEGVDKLESNAAAESDIKLESDIKSETGSKLETNFTLESNLNLESELKLKSDLKPASNLESTENWTELSDELRSYTEETIKIAMVQWVKGYSVGMDDMFSELTLEKLECTPSGLERKKLESHTQLFANKDEENHSEKTYPVTDNTAGRLWRWAKRNLGDISIFITSLLNLCFPRDINSKHRTHYTRKCKQTRGEKVLVKGAVGIGKTTLVNKIAYDWAKGLFTAFSLIFLVSLKLVRPGDTIESVIIQQNPVLEGLNIKEQSLKKILEIFGSRCLLILDSLDEHELGSNEDILKIIEGRKLLTCNVFVTARPPNSTYIEQYFKTIVEIRGFSEKEAKKYISNVATSKKVAEGISANFLEQNSPYTCPIMLLFVCILVNSETIDLKRNNFSIGGIYTELIRCLYRRFTIRRGIQFEQIHFKDILKRVGKLAWIMLQSGNYWFLISEVIDIAGENAFEYGLFNVNQDFTCFIQETTKVLITFPHDSIQQFLGSYYFVQMLNEGKSIQTLLHPDCKEPIFMRNPLFLTFCLWFLNDECLQNRKYIEESLVSYIVERINFGQLDMTEITERFPIFQVSDFQMEYRPILKFLEKVLSKSDNIEELTLNSTYPRGWLLDLIPPQSQSMQIVINHETHEVRSKYLSLKNEDLQNSMIVVNKTECQGIDFDKHWSLIVDENNKTSVDLSMFICGFQKLGGLQIYIPSNCTVIAKNHIQSSPFLTEISLVELNIDDSVFLALSKAIEKNNLPNLCSLSFEGCGQGLKGKLSMLFQCKWISLVRLNLQGCLLDKRDRMTLSPNVFPSLSSLSLGSKLAKEPKMSLNFAWPNITQLWLHDITKKEYFVVTKEINDGTLPQLNDLGICMIKTKQGQLYNTDENENNDKNCKELDLNGTLVFPRNMSTLTCLSIHRFIDIAEHLSEMSKSLSGTKLLKLDISHSSGITGSLSKLLHHRFPSLNTLILSDCGLNSQDLFCLSQANVEGRLPQLTHLDISKNHLLVGQLDKLFSSDKNRYQFLRLNTQQERLSDQDFRVLVDKLHSSPIQKLKFSSQLADDLYKKKWSYLKALYISCPVDLSIHVKILDPMPRSIENKLLPKLGKVALMPIYVCTQKQPLPSTKHTYLDPTKTNDILRPFPFEKMNQLLKEVKDGSMTEESAVQSLTNFTVEILGTIADGEVVNHPEFRSMLYSMILVTFRSMENSHPLDWDALSNIAGDYHRKKSLSVSESKLNSSVVNLMTDMKPILQGFMDYGTVVNLQKLSEIKSKLRKLSVKVYIFNN